MPIVFALILCAWCPMCRRSRSVPRSRSRGAADVLRCRPVADVLPVVLPARQLPAGLPPRSRPVTRGNVAGPAVLPGQDRPPRSRPAVLPMCCAAGRLPTCCPWCCRPVNSRPGCPTLPAGHSGALPARGAADVPRVSPVPILPTCRACRVYRRDRRVSNRASRFPWKTLRRIFAGQASSGLSPISAARPTITGRRSRPRASVGDPNGGPPPADLLDSRCNSRRGGVSGGV